MIGRGKSKLMTDLIRFLQRHEGFRFLPYLCTANKNTVFYGRNIDDTGFNGDEILSLFKAIEIALDNCDDETAQKIEDALLETGMLALNNDAEYAEAALQNIFHDMPIYTENRRIALVSIMMNLGSSRFRGFKKMIQAVKERNWTEAAIQLKDSKRHRQVTHRSNEEANLMEIG